MPRKKGSVNRKPLSVDEQYMGTEPHILKITSQGAMINALNWYNYFHDAEVGKAYAMKAYPELKDVPANELRTLGWLCRLMERGTDLGAYANRPKELAASLAKKFVRPTPTPIASEESTISLATRNARKNSAIIAELESEIDEHWRNPKYKFDAYKWMVGKEIGGPGAKAVIAFYERWENKDGFINGIIRAADQIVANKRVVRKARKKKPVSAVKQSSKVQFKQSDVGLKLESISPVDIVGAKELWVYNTDKRVLAVYRGESLSVKGTTVQGYNEAESFTKKLRKPEKDMDLFRNNNKSGMKRNFDKLTTKAANVSTGRLNADTILIKAFK